MYKQTSKQTKRVIFEQNEYWSDLKWSYERDVTNFSTLPLFETERNTLALSVLRQDSFLRRGEIRRSGLMYVNADLLF